jgi:hypothetical protein
MMLQVSMNLKAKTEFKELLEWFGSYLTTCDEQSCKLFFCNLTDATKSELSTQRIVLIIMASIGSKSSSGGC